MEIKLLEIKQKYQKFKYRSIIDRLLFNSAISNNIYTIFITANGLNNAQDGLINGKTHKTLGTINSTEIKDWNSVKCKSKWINANLTHSENSGNVSDFGFGFVTKHSHDLLNFTKRKESFCFRF